MTVTTPNLLLMLCFPLICLGFGVAMDVAMIVVGRRKPTNFPGGANRLYWAVMISALIRSAVFSLMFLPAVALEGQILVAYATTQLETSILIVMPALFGAYFATRLERHVIAMLESPLLRDKARFLSLARRPRPEVRP